MLLYFRPVLAARSSDDHRGPLPPAPHIVAYYVHDPRDCHTFFWAIQYQKLKITFFFILENKNCYNIFRLCSRLRNIFKLFFFLCQLITIIIIISILLYTCKAYSALKLLCVEKHTSPHTWDRQKGTAQIVWGSHSTTILKIKTMQFQFFSYFFVLYFVRGAKT